MARGGVVVVIFVYGGFGVVGFVFVVVLVYFLYRIILGFRLCFIGWSSFEDDVCSFDFRIRFLYGVRVCIEFFLGFLGLAEMVV